MTPRDLVAASAALTPGRLTETLRSLVATPSVNPGTFELAMAERVAGWLEPTGAEVGLVEFAPGRPSVGAVLRGTGDGPTLVLNGHMDTVPVDDASLWTTAPFGGEVRDGHLYGRGACDMKAGLALQLAVAEALAPHRDRLRGSLVLHFAAGEECGEPGTLSLIQAGYTGDVGITTEPTGLRVATAVRGAAWLVVRVRGRSIHASRAHLGVNPLGAVPRVLEAIEAYDREVRARPHPLLPGGMCTPTTVRAGVKENAVADTCELVLDRRFIPGETIDGELRDLRARLDALRADDPSLDIELDVKPHAFEAAEIPAGSAFATRVLDEVERVTGDRPPIWGTPYGSDVRNLIRDAGIEAVTFGPGNVEECHCADERVSLAELHAATLVVAGVASDLLF